MARRGEQLLPAKEFFSFFVFAGRLILEELNAGAMALICRLLFGFSILPCFNFPLARRLLKQ